MTPWLDEYLLALKERDTKEKAEQDLYDTYTRLADRTAALSTDPSNQHRKSPQESPVPASGEHPSVPGRQPNVLDRDALIKVQEDLSEAQRSRGAIQLQLQSLTEETKRLRLRSKADSRRISELVAERTHLATRMRDRDEELRGKAKLLQDVHDETVSLTLELNVVEERCRELERENKELVDRWMARMGEEADALNKASKFS